MDHRQGSRPCPQPEEAGGKSKQEVDDEGPPWLRKLDQIREPDCTQVIVDRIEQCLWVLDHQDDLDADFLAIYGIDLQHTDISSRRYFALAYRLTAYTGVMAARLDAERDGRPTGSTPTRTSSTPAPERGDVTELSLTQFRAKFPWMVSMGQGG